MLKALTSFAPRQQRSVRGQITDEVRAMIRDGRMPPGHKLPPALELARLWRTPTPTVHRALAQLVQEGLLERTPRVGTFVRQRPKGLTDLAIYDGGSVWRDPQHAFARALCHELHMLCDAAGINTHLWVDPRAVSEQDEPWAALARAATAGQFQALIVPVTDLPHIAWLRKLAVPSVFISPANLRNRVSSDTRQFAADGIRLLAEQGCRSVGVISPMYPERHNPDGSPHEYGMLYQELERAAEQFNLDYRPEWIFRPGGQDMTSAAFEQFGYDGLQALWRLPERPNGLLVTNDLAARGTLMAIMRQQIQVPEELKLALHRNAEIGLFSPVPAAFVDLHVREMAAALLDQARRLYDGEEIAPVLIPYHAVPAAGVPQTTLL